MKRKLPKIDGDLYLGPNFVKSLLNPDEYTVWATGVDSPSVIQLVRKATHEIPNSKWVEFAVVPEAILLNRSPLYASPLYAGMRVRCDWSDFLRLTRWRKNVQHLEPTQQAWIAAVTEWPTHDAAHPYRLIAVDHGIRRKARS